MALFFRRLLIRTGAFWILILAPLLRADDLALPTENLPPPFVLDLPVQPDEATPAWLGHPEIPQTTFATLDLPIMPPDEDASLLVTVYFQEQEGGFLRVTWQGGGSAQMLSNNFYEGIGMDNQRSLLITPGTMSGAGMLCFQSGGTTLGIQRIKLEWLGNKSGLVSPLIDDLLVTPALGPTVPGQSLNGQPPQTGDTEWQGQLISVPITQLPQRIEQGVEFSVELDTVPVAGRIALQENGLAWGSRLAVWINQQRAGTITPEVPDLGDAGYLSGTTPYVGWRNGTFHVPASLLKVGVNTIQFSAEDENNAADVSTSPLAVKNVVFQIVSPPPVPDAGTGAGTASVPNPADTSSTTTTPPTPPTPAPDTSTPPDTSTNATGPTPPDASTNATTPTPPDTSTNTTTDAPIEILTPDSTSTATSTNSDIGPIAPLPSPSNPPLTTTTP
jgi:hypothetical protein